MNRNVEGKKVKLSRTIVCLHVAAAGILKRGYFW